MANNRLYYVGDLRHVFTDTEWFATVKLRQQFTGPEYTLRDGRKFCLLPTFTKTGHYRDQWGKVYNVETGTLGAIFLCFIRDNVRLNRVIETGVGHIHRLDYRITLGNCEIDRDWMWLGQIGIVQNPAPIAQLDRATAF